MRNQKGFAQVLVIAVVLLIALIAIFYFVKNQGGNPLSNPLTQTSNQSAQETTVTNQASVPAINSPQDLTTASNDLDSTDINGLNTQLNQNDTDASNF